MAKNTKHAKRAKLSPRILTDEQVNALQATGGLRGRYLAMRVSDELAHIWIRLDPDDRKQAIAQLAKANDKYAGTLGHIVQLDRI